MFAAGLSTRPVATFVGQTLTRRSKVKHLRHDLPAALVPQQGQPVVVRLAETDILHLHCRHNTRHRYGGGSPATPCRPMRGSAPAHGIWMWVAVPGWRRRCQPRGGRGSRVGGIDAAGALLSIARERTPGGDFRQGELEALPFADAGFDLVTGFNAFQFAGEPAQALRAGAPVLARPRILSPHCRTDPWTIGAARQLWIFAVRSLIWNPRFDVAERRAATAVVARRSNQEDPSMTLPAFFDAMPPDPLNL